MLRLAADLHVHTVISPCASPDMTPARILEEAARRGLAMIAICDHNTAAGLRAVAAAAAAASEGPIVIPGMEITTREEAHVLGWFPSAEAAAEAASALDVDPALASSATQLGLSETVELIHRHGGLAAAAHVDRRSFSVPGQLGFIPGDVPFDALEISSAGVARGRAADFSNLGIPLVSSSDSHFLEDLGSGVTYLQVEAAVFEELSKAIAGAEGRRCALA